MITGKDYLKELTIQDQIIYDNVEGMHSLECLLDDFLQHNQSKNNKVLDLVSNRTWVVTIECGHITEDWKIIVPNELSAKITASSNYNGKRFKILRYIDYGC